MEARDTEFAKEDTNDIELLRIIFDAAEFQENQGIHLQRAKEFCSSIFSNLKLYIYTEA